MNKERLDFVFENCPCINLGKAVRSLNRYFDEFLDPYSINAAKLILLISIERCSEGTTQKQLTQDLSIQQSSLSRSLKDLVDKKWATYKEEKVGTKMVKTIFLSDKGREKLHEVIPIWEDSYKKVMGLLDSKSWSSILDKIKTINKL